MVLIRDVVVVLVVMVLQIAHVCELAVASLLICVLQEAFSVTDGYQQFCSKRGNSAFEKSNTYSHKAITKQKQIALSKQEHAFLSLNDKTHLYRM